MQKIFSIGIAILSLIIGQAEGKVSMAASNKSDNNQLQKQPHLELVFEGTVVRMEPAPAEKGVKNWVVTMRVDKIIQGTFEGKTFSFRIHSPAQSGLETGKQYKIRAMPAGKGYDVDPFQWNR